MADIQEIADPQFVVLALMPDHAGYTTLVHTGSGDHMEEAVLDFVRLQFRRSAERGALGAESPLFSTGVIDSFGVLELIAFVERAYGVDIDLAAHALEDFDTAAKIAAVVRRLQSIT